MDRDMGIRLHGRHAHPALMLALLAGILALAGCGSSSVAHPAGRTASTAAASTSNATSTHAATSTSTHTTNTATSVGTTAPSSSSGDSSGQPSATVAPGPGAPTGFAGAPCTAEAFTTHGETVAHLGDILLGQLDFNSGYPGYVLPDDLRLAPYQIGGDAIGPLPDLSNPANGVAFKLCNASATQAHVISAIAIRIDSFAGYSGHLNEIRLCAPVYSRQGMRGGGCGGGFPFDVNLAATFAANASTGDVANAGFTPITLSPGEEIVVSVRLTLPTPPGTYAFRGGIALDGGAIAYLAAPSTLALYAPVAHEWSGQNCTRPDMLAQIPLATTPPTYYICPSA